MGCQTQTALIAASHLKNEIRVYAVEYSYNSILIKNIAVKSAATGLGLRNSGKEPSNIRCNLDRTYDVFCVHITEYHHGVGFYFWNTIYANNGINLSREKI